MKFILSFVLVIWCLIATAQQVGSKVSFKAVDGKTYTGIVKEIENSRYKIKYDGFEFESWLERDILTFINLPSAPAAPTQNTQPIEQQNTLQTSGDFRVGQKVEAFNSGWWKATILKNGTGKNAGYVFVHYDDYSSASDQWVAEKKIRQRKEKVGDNYGAGPRNGEYTIRSYGGNIYNPLILGYFNLSNGKYKYYDAGKDLLGTGTYQYDANTKQVNWNTGELKKYNPSAGFEVSREGKTHTIQLKRGVPATNSTDSK